MRRLAVALVVVALVGALVGCGGGVLFVSGRSEFGRSEFAASGFVSIVHLTIIDGNAQITVVTLLNSGTAQTLTFCGNVVAQFPSDAFVTVTFRQASGCNTVVGVG
jgi:ABC-type uncharacterized transport system permease subunit